MTDAMRLAGYFAAHAVWSIADGSTLVPLLGCRLPDGTKELQRFAAEQLEAAVAQGRQYLSENPRSASCAVLIFDGFIHVDGGRVDALLLEVREYPQVSITMALPYRPAKKPKGLGLFRRGQKFALYLPKFLDFGPLSEDAFPELAGAFFDGAAAHEQGFAVWQASLDPNMKALIL